MARAAAETAVQALTTTATRKPRMTALERIGGRTPRLFLSFCVALGCTSPALAQRWTIEPRIGGRATLTNNANYQNGSEREPDLVFNILPGVDFLREGPRLRVNGSASLDIIGYADGTQTNRIFPQANILANYEAVERFFFIEGELLANQEILNPFLPQSETDSTFNRYTYVQARVAPYFQGNFGDNTWRYLVRSDNSYTYTTQADASLDNAYYGRHLAEVVRAATPFGGSLRVQSDITRFDDERQPDQHLEIALATVNYAFTPQFVAGLRGGYERTNYTANDDSGPVYGAELTWTPNPRTRVGGFWESRFFGPSYLFEASNRQRALAANLSASRSITTYPQLILQLPSTGNVSGLVNAILVARFPDPVERARQVQDLIDRQALPASLPSGINIFSQGVNIVTSGTGTLAWMGVRNTLALTLYYLKTAPLPESAIPPTFIAFNNNIQKGASLSFSHRLSPVMLLNAGISRSETRGFDQTAGQNTDENVLEVQATRQLTPRSSGFVGARYRQWDSTSTFLGNSDEAAIFVGLFYRL